MPDSVTDINYGYQVNYEGLRHQIVGINQKEEIVCLRPVAVMKSDDKQIPIDYYDVWVRVENIELTNVIAMCS